MSICSYVNKNLAYVGIAGAYGPVAVAPGGLRRRLSVDYERKIK